MSSPLLRVLMVSILLAAAASQLRAGNPASAQTITVPLNGIVRLHLAKSKDGTSKAPLIGSIDIEKSGILEVRPAVNDQTTVIVRGIALGITRLELVSLDDKQRATYEVIVEPDMELLNYLLKRVTPTASVKPIAIGNSGIVLTGTVKRAEDIPTILAITRAYAAGR
jgi:Flp pilus assembly secretin CpaC